MAQTMVCEGQALELITGALEREDWRHGASWFKSFGVSQTEALTEFGVLLNV